MKFKNENRIGMGGLGLEVVGIAYVGGNRIIFPFLDLIPKHISTQICTSLIDLYNKLACCASCSLPE